MAVSSSSVAGEGFLLPLEDTHGIWQGRQPPDTPSDSGMAGSPGRI